MVKEPIVSGHLTSLFQSVGLVLGSGLGLGLGLVLGFRVSFRVSPRVRLRIMLLALHYFLPHYFRCVRFNVKRSAA